MKNHQALLLASGQAARRALSASLSRPSTTPLGATPRFAELSSVRAVVVEAAAAERDDREHGTRAAHAAQLQVPDPASVKPRPPMGTKRQSYPVGWSASCRIP